LNAPDYSLIIRMPKKEPTWRSCGSTSDVVYMCPRNNMPPSAKVTRKILLVYRCVHRCTRAAAERNAPNSIPREQVSFISSARRFYRISCTARILPHCSYLPWRFATARYVMRAWPTPNFRVQTRLRS